MALLNVIEKVQVSPAKKSSDDSLNSFTLPLNFFEIRYMKQHPNQQVIFYRLTESSVSDAFHSHIVPKLKLSLSQALRYNLPLTGRLTWDPQDTKPCVIVSEHDTVSLTVAETDLDFSSFLSNEPRPVTDHRPLLPELTVSDDSAALLSVQITLFPKQGFCISIASHHSVNDGETAALFIKSWSHICRHSNGPMEFPLLPEDLSPNYDRTTAFVNVPPGLESKMVEFVSSGDSSKSLKPTLCEFSHEVVRATVELTLENIEKLRERVKIQSARSHHLSTFVLAYAYTWTCAVKARGGDPSRAVRFRYLADFRARLDPPLPATYFGTCVFPIGWFQYEAGTFLKEDGFVKAVEILSDSIKGLGSQGIESLFENYVEGTKKIKPGEQFGSVAGSTRLRIKETDFGWGRPVKNEFLSIDRSGSFSMMGLNELGGLEIGLCLKKSQMNAFLSLFEDGLSN